MTDRHAATHDPMLSAGVRDHRPMRDEAGASHDEDRPPHVRAASGPGCFQEYLVIVQDDASWLALIDTDDRVHTPPFPAISDGCRVLSASRGTKHHKADRETLPSEIFDAELGAGFLAA